MYDIDRNKLKEIIDKRLMNVSLEIKKKFPVTLSRPIVYWFNIPSEKNFILSFGGSVEKERIEKLVGIGYHPYPGLIAENKNEPIAFDIANSSRNLFFQGCSVKDMLAFFLGENTSMILTDFKHSIFTKELGEYDYKIDLAYILSFGDEITRVNFYDYLDDLIAFSINQWRNLYV